MTSLKSFLIVYNLEGQNTFKIRHSLAFDHSLFIPSAYIMFIILMMSRQGGYMVAYTFNASVTYFPTQLANFLVFTQSQPYISLQSFQGRSTFCNRFDTGRTEIFADLSEEQNYQLPIISNKTCSHCDISNLTLQ